MKDKEKQIEEMAKIIDSDCYNCKNCNVLKRYKNQDGLNGITCSAIKKAEELYNLYNQKSPEDSVVISKEEYENIYEQAEANVLANIADGGTSCHWCMEKHQKIGYEKGSKETAEKILTKLQPYIGGWVLFKELENEYGVKIEIKE